MKNLRKRLARWWWSVRNPHLERRVSMDETEDSLFISYQIYNKRTGCSTIAGGTGLNKRFAESQEQWENAVRLTKEKWL